MKVWITRTPTKTRNETFIPYIAPYDTPSLEKTRKLVKYNLHTPKSEEKKMKKTHTK